MEATPTVRPPAVCRPDFAGAPTHCVFFCVFFVFEASGKRSCIRASRCPATFREGGRWPMINQDSQDRPAAFMPVDQAVEELGPLGRSADVRVAARLKTSRLKCTCAADVRGDSQSSCFSSFMRFSLDVRLKPGRPPASGRFLTVCSGGTPCFFE